MRSDADSAPLPSPQEAWDERHATRDPIESHDPDPTYAPG